MKQLWGTYTSAGTEASNFADRIYLYVARLLWDSLGKIFQHYGVNRDEFVILRHALMFVVYYKWTDVMVVCGLS
jgi:hypothetical protein